METIIVNSSELSLLAEARQIINSSNGSITLDHAFKLAKTRDTLLGKLRSGIAYFQFIKRDGSIRNAIGTLNPRNYEYEFKTESAPNENPLIVKYWDIEKKGWRSVKVETIQSIAL
jgi:hypothetical protein